MKILGFSAKVKEELCGVPLENSDFARAESYGALLFGNILSQQKIQLSTTDPAFAERLVGLFAIAFDGLTFDQIVPTANGGKINLHIHNQEKINAVWHALDLDCQLSTVNCQLSLNFALLEEDPAKTAFLRGAFLAAGAVTDPTKSYHLEFSTLHRRVSRAVVPLVRECAPEVTLRETMRRGKCVLYCKKSEQIADFLTLIGAPVCAMAHMNTAIDKTLQNKVQRQVNCDSANLDKRLDAATLQLAAIRKIEAEQGLSALPESLYQTAILRVMNPEASMAELALLAVPPVSKSAIAGRLRRIVGLVG